MSTERTAEEISETLCLQANYRMTVLHITSIDEEIKILTELPPTLYGNDYLNKPHIMDGIAIALEKLTGEPRSLQEKTI